jgi:hypothetical protein
MPNWSQGLQGAAGGAAAGGVLGGPIGAGIGGALGGLGGLLGGSSAPQLAGYGRRNDSLWSALNGAQGRDGAQIGQYERSSGGQEFRTGQQALISQLQRQASGRGPSLAGMQARQAADVGMANQLSMAAGAGPGNEALAARQAMQNNAGISANLAMTSAQARMAEQLNARQQLAGVLGNARGQDIGNEQFNAGSYNSRQLSQAQLNQQNLGRNDAYEMGLRGLELDNARAKMGAHSPNTFGTQMMSGGANLLAMYGMGQIGGQRPQEPTAGDANFYTNGSFRWA